jgi:hypothetical protein
MERARHLLGDTADAAYAEGRELGLFAAVAMAREVAAGGMTDDPDAGPAGQIRRSL